MRATVILKDINLFPQNNLNFTYKLRKSKDLNWGAQSADGSWNGMIKELLLEEQDMGNFQTNNLH